MYVDTKSELERAKAYFYDRRLMEAYGIFRRYFDRLPFKPEPEHALYIAYFTRILLELGKDFELKFYLTTLEKLYRDQGLAEQGYQLAVVYGDSGMIQESKRILEEVIATSPNEFVRSRALMRLAHCYDVLGQPDKVKEIIHSIPETKDREFQRLLRIWQAKVCIDALDFQKADEVLHSVLSELTLQSNWYTYCSTRIMLGYLALKENNTQKAKAIAAEVRADTDGHHFRSLAKQLAALETSIQLAMRGGVVLYRKKVDSFEVSHGDQSRIFKEKNLAERLLESFLKAQRLTKSEIIRTLYRRTYRGTDDDKLIYYHVHSLRKILKGLGLPDHVLEVDDQSYVFQPEVRLLAEES